MTRTGLICPSRHVNHPGARYCADCGAAMIEGVAGPAEVPCIPPGVLVLDSGLVVPLDGACIIGSAAARDATPLPEPRRKVVVDGDPAIDAVHAELWIDGWDAYVSDCGSATGTFMAGDDEGTWVRLPSREPVPLRGRTLLRLGPSRTLLFEPRFLPR